MVLRSIGVMSMAKMMGTLYAVIGFLIGLLFAMLSMVGAGFAQDGSGFFAMMMGVGGVIILPIFYGVIGFIAGVIGSALYNLIAGMAGGIELDLQ
jgi:hypothetical protein